MSEKLSVTITFIFIIYLYLYRFAVLWEGYFCY